MHSTTEFEQEKREFQSLLATGMFDRAPNLAQVLTYVCEKYFEGAAEQIKEYNIAVEALGRPVGFDQKRDSIVRVEAHRLRKRLREYYESDGAGHDVRLEIPPGQYAPLFVRQSTAEPALPAVETPVVSLPPETPALAEDWSTSQTIGPIQAPVPYESPVVRVVDSPPGRRHSGLWIAASLGALAISGVFLWQASAARPVHEDGVILPGAAASSSQPIRILPGLKSGTYTDRFGRVWQADRYYQDGSISESTGHTVAGTHDQRLFTDRREGAFTYDIPLPAGSYEARLYFAENVYGENNTAGGGETSRIFNVYANSVPILKDFDVIREVGASTADVRAFKNLSPASDGKLHLKFEPNNNPAIVSAIEVIPGVPGRMVPIRMVSRDRPYTDKDGRTWEADSYSRGGQLVMRTEPITNTDDPELLRGERYGSMTYTIAVPPGRYGVTMYFAESWFGPGQAAGGGIGSRTFDILCNGVALRRDFDIFKEAHGSQRAVIVPVHGLEPDPDGKLVISLMPVRNYASLNALEVVDESK
ncbi:MAG TPA: malectin domain-containing carbohydrate-binding protein [Bryobacteraceae bacterium]|jgi:hypothetical protein|nr:malectin domain-containing carbohydrate-binding protein [Bryobacteraceae bacterium]